MELNRDRCYRALKSRDARFDGRFFTGVATTGVYCRPICPARTPRRGNCTFFGSAAAAAEAGFRPCLRCRPETSPGTPAWLGSSATVSRALRLIGEGALIDDSVEALAERVGLGARQLRRLFIEHLGASPAAVEQTRRVHFAKKLLDETNLPITQIAFSAGFGSVRRFNSAIRDVYDRSPRELRKAGTKTTASPTLRLRLGYRAPYDWSQVMRFLELRAIPHVESVGTDEYVRSVSVADCRGVVRVTPGDKDCLILETPVAAAPHLLAMIARVRALFDLGADPARISQQLAEDRDLRQIVRRSPGLRVPGAWDPFELGVRAILGQQVTVRGATTLAGRLVERYGDELPDGSDGVDRLFPNAQRLAEMAVEDQGMPKKRAETIRSFARAVVRDPRLLDGSHGLDAAVGKLCAIPGFGPWTANYIAMRAFAEPDAFPASDLGLLRAVGARRGGGAVSPSDLASRAEAWRPWRAYAAVHLWNTLG